MRKKYGAVYSMKVGSYKLVVAEDSDSVKEVLVKKSADYAGRPPFHSLVMTTLGMSSVYCEIEVTKMPARNCNSLTHSVTIY